MERLSHSTVLMITIDDVEIVPIATVDNTVSGSYARSDCDRRKFLLLLRVIRFGQPG